MPSLQAGSRHNIRTRLLLFVLLPFVLIIIVSGWYSLRALELSAQARMEEDIQLIARAIRPALGHALEYGHRATIRRTVTSAFDMDQVYGIYVYNRHGRRISAIGDLDAEVRGDQAASLASIGDEQGTFEEVDGEEVFSYFMPLSDSGGRIIGLLQITRQGTDFTDYLAAFRIRALALLISASLLLILVIWIGYQRALGRHLRTMGQSMARIGAGDLGHRLPLKGPAEIRGLSQGINTMLDSIVASEHELERQRERELALKTRLHESEKLAAIGRFAAGIAHELGTPLSVADGKAQRALRHCDADQAHSLGAIRQQLQRMERIIRQLMNFARPVKPEHRQVKVTELIQSALQQVDDDRQRSGTHIQITGDTAPPSLTGDRLRLEQALINLLRNAMQAAPGGQVELHWQCREGSVHLCVDDDGPGIDASVKADLLEPFVTTKPVGMGTGLGLAVVNAVVTEHGGQITLGRSPLGGARFCLSLPLDNMP